MINAKTAGLQDIAFYLHLSRDVRKWFLLHVHDAFRVRRLSYCRLKLSYLYQAFSDILAIFVVVFIVCFFMIHTSLCIDFWLFSHGRPSHAQTSMRKDSPTACTKKVGMPIVEGLCQKVVIYFVLINEGLDGV